MSKQVVNQSRFSGANIDDRRREVRRSSLVFTDFLPLLTSRMRAAVSWAISPRNSLSRSLVVSMVSRCITAAESSSIGAESATTNHYFLGRKFGQMKTK
jgi:hypothetical protein